MYVYSASFVELTSQCWLLVVIVMCSIVRAHLANGHCNMDCCAINCPYTSCVSRITTLICWVLNVHVSIDQDPILLCFRIKDIACST
jgi:hypothetical protein